MSSLEYAQGSRASSGLLPPGVLAPAQDQAPTEASPLPPSTQRSASAASDGTYATVMSRLPSVDSARGSLDMLRSPSADEAYSSAVQSR